MPKNLRTFTFFLAFSLILLTLAACGPAATPAAGELKPFASVCDKANDGKNVAVEGYLRFPDSFTGTQSVVLRLYQASNFSGAPLGVQTEFGSAANQVNPVADQFKDSDLVVHLANGQPAKFGAKVRVSGHVYFPAVGQEFACGLETPYLELAP